MHEPPDRVVAGEPHAGHGGHRGGGRAQEARLQRRVDGRARTHVDRQGGQRVELGVGEPTAGDLPRGRGRLAPPAATPAEDGPVGTDDNRAHRRAPGLERVPRLGKRLPRHGKGRPSLGSMSVMGPTRAPRTPRRHAPDLVAASVTVPGS